MKLPGSHRRSSHKEHKATETACHKFLAAKKESPGWRRGEVSQLSNQKNPITKQDNKPPVASTFDEHLYELKMSEPTQRIKKALGDAYFVLSAVGGSDSSYFSERSREFLDAADTSCRETLEADGSAVTPELIEKVLVPHVLAAFDFLRESVRRDLSAPTWSDPGRLLGEVRLSELKKTICSKYEIEFIELKKRTALPPKVRQRTPNPQGWSDDLCRSLRDEGWLKSQRSLNQKEAAYSLAIKDRSIRNLVKQKKLVLTPKKRVAINPAFWSQYHLKHSAPK
jgi:hypothetical protein